MIYGLYLSAMGVLANSNRQDVIANNLANAETVGFKRDLSLFQEQRTEARMKGLDPARFSNPVLEELGGGLAAAPMAVDMSQGEIEGTGNPLDVAIRGDGYLAVVDHGQTMLTRDGRLKVDSQGFLTSAIGGQRILDDNLRPISLKPGPVAISPDGTITQSGAVAGRIGLFDVPQRSLITKRGGNLLSYPEGDRQLRPGRGVLQSEAVERANADPTTELVALMDAQRQLEANANMIRYQDQTLSRLVNDVGKIG